VIGGRCHGPVTSSV